MLPRDNDTEKENKARNTDILDSEPLTIGAVNQQAGTTIPD